MSAAGTREAPPSAAGYDPFDPAVLRDPFPHYRRLRRETPVAWHEGLGQFLVSRYDDCVRCLLDAEGFANEPGYGPAFDHTYALPPAPGDPHHAIYRPQRGRMIMFADGREHGALRRLATKHFTARAMHALEPLVQALADRLLDALVERAAAGETVDLYRDYADILPFGAIVHLLDIPEADTPPFRDRVAAVTFGIGLPSDEVARASEALCAFFDEVVEARRAAPGDDVISTLVRSADRFTPPLDTAEISAFAIMLFAAGTDTTAGLIGNWLELALVERPDLWQAVQQDPGLVPASIEEMLRFRSSNQVVPRAATRDHVIGGVEIPAGSIVSLLLGSANRDEAHFGPDAERYRLDREPTDALGFGHGPHFCLGATLARMECRIALESLLRRFHRLELTGPVEHAHSFWLRACRSIPARPA